MSEEATSHRATPLLSALHRHTLAEWGAALGLLCLPALAVSIPRGLLPFGLLLLATSLLALQRMRRAAAGLQPSLRWLGVLALLVIGLSVCSLLYFGQAPKDIDNRTRFLVLPWAALWVYALRPPRQLLWWGALLGIVVTLALAIAQVLQGLPRAEGWTNAIVLADVVLVLMVVAVFCRPHGHRPWTIVALVAGCATILLSGSRGVWPGMLLLLVVTALCLRWRSGGARLVILGVLAALAAVLVLSVPALTRQTRLVELHHDVQRYERGDSDSSAGARIERLQVAAETFVEHPLVGVGVGRFDNAMRRLPDCRGAWVQRCHLGHAHNDLAEWSATQGLPGTLLIVMIYGVPLWLLVRLYRRRPHRAFHGPAAAGIMVVAVYILCGMTQSMFAHQVTTGFYVSLVGVLIGLAACDAEAPRWRLGAAEGAAGSR
ncbi:O-antigen ligase family protein [Xanthomonas theicola]|uniref:Polymerase n=1 Tax=Xanthomonas theicola TaxID=56464 RepID=A0A2S6ZGH4_9XANT|nr:O-antigen ligase [Xanthomonas theicola]PPT91316.1 polymerase [Xanthomonas theicola]QNH26602.1 O-antigen ligase family protein [Xanthomonas theicola]